jgi:hypothetical protein
MRPYAICINIASKCCVGMRKERKKFAICINAFSKCYVGMRKENKEKNLQSVSIHSANVV